MKVQRSPFESRASARLRHLAGFMHRAFPLPLLVGLTLSSCSRNADVVVGWTPPAIPVEIQVAGDGALSVALVGKLLTPLGTFAIGTALTHPTGQLVIIENVPAGTATHYLLDDNLRCIEVLQDDGVAVRVDRDSTTVSFYKQKPYSIVCYFADRTVTNLASPYPEPEYHIRYHIAGDYFFYDFSPLRWTTGIARSTWSPCGWEMHRGRYEILDWLGLVCRWGVNVAWCLGKAVVLTGVAVIELVLLLPFGLVFRTGWRAPTVIAGVAIFALLLGLCFESTRERLGCLTFLVLGDRPSTVLWRLALLAACVVVLWRMIH